VVVRVTVSDEIRAARLRARNRESADDIARRLERKDPGRHRPVNHEIKNDGAVQDASAKLLGIIESHLDERTGIV
jgi:ribose 1,5-bisphosphokinase